MAIPPRGLISENTLNDNAAKDPKTKPAAPTVIADIQRDNFVSSHNHDTGASIIAIDDVKAAKKSKIKNKAPKIIFGSNEFIL